MCIRDRYLAWTDARNNPMEIYFDEYAYPEYSWPEIGINHGFCLNITADVCSPRTPAYYVDWTIRIDGGILFTEREISDFIEKISAGAQEGVGTGWVFGFGKILITVEIDQWYGDSVTENAYGFIFGPFVYVF